MPNSGKIDQVLLLHWYTMMQTEMGTKAILPGNGWFRKKNTSSEITNPDFLKRKPYFKGTEGVVGLTQWFEKMESVFSISNCTVACQVKFATCTLQENALTWWNSHVKTTTPEVAHAMPWKTLKKMMTDKYSTGQAENKRKLDNNNQTQQQLSKRQNVAQAYAAGTGERKEYAGTLPLCNNFAATNNQRTLTCYECGNQGHYRSDCPELKNRNHGNQAEGTEARGMVGPFKVLEQVESVAYKLKLPQELSRVHNTFHVSNLRKCYADEPLVVPLGGLHLDNEL
ncbi:reverse transcriptase domain-containing protein [Tanacetum coccineum]